MLPHVCMESGESTGTYLYEVRMAVFYAGFYATPAVEPFSLPWGEADHASLHVHYSISRVCRGGTNPARSAATLHVRYRYLGMPAIGVVVLIQVGSVLAVWWYISGTAPVVCRHVDDKAPM